MKVLIAGGAGFLGSALTKSLLVDTHQVYLLSRAANPKVPAGAEAVKWDGKTTVGWGDLVNEMDVVIHLAGKSLSSWPWTAKTKRAFLDSRLIPGRALVEAIRKATQHPRLFIQQSGINHYGLHGGLADESTPPGDGFLAQLTVKWEAATKSVEELGVRRVITRTAVVLAESGGLMPLMVLPVKLFVGGPLGSGRQAMPWIHLKDWVSAVRFLMDDENARGAYNLVAPTPASNAEFNRSLAEVLCRPYWFPTPPFLLGTVLGEMSVLITEGRFSQPKRLTESGFRFQFPGPREAFLDLYR
ncbi:MAG: TIGR01777 family oxidoreductase [Chloroflexota bacterium]